MHDVGTIGASSGQGSGTTLAGINTPTLEGLWLSAPYLHNGSLAMLAEVLADVTHMRSELTAPSKADLEAYLLQIDTNSESPRLAQAQAQGNAQSATYRVTFEGKWTTTATPGGVPAGAHFSPLSGAVHNSGATFWSAGGTASLGIEAVAELGNTGPFTTEINANMNAVAVIEKSLQGGGTPTATGDFTVTTDHPLVTMIAPSPDWFVGVHGESLLDAGGQWRTSHSVDCASIWIAPQRMRTSFAFEMATMPPKVSGVDYSVSWDGDYFSDGFGGGTPRNPSSRRSSRISAMTSAKFSRTSSRVLP